MTLEDFTDYTEEEPDDRIQKTANHIDHNSYRNEDSYVYKDFGVDHFGDFTHTVDSLCNSAVNGSIAVVWALQNLVDDLFGNRGVGKPAQIYFLILRANATTLNTYLGEDVNNSSQSNLASIPINTQYYLKVVKSGTSLVLGIYSTSELRDAGDGTDGDVGNTSLTLTDDYKFRYMFPCNTHNDNENLLMVSDIDNLDLHEVVVTKPSGSIIPILQGIGIL